MISSTHTECDSFYRKNSQTQFGSNFSSRLLVSLNIRQTNLQKNMSVCHIQCLNVLITSHRHESGPWITERIFTMLGYYSGSIFFLFYRLNRICFIKYKPKRSVNSCSRQSNPSPHRVTPQSPAGRNRAFYSVYCIHTYSLLFIRDRRTLASRNYAVSTLFLTGIFRSCNLTILLVL